MSDPGPDPRPLNIHCLTSQKIIVLHSVHPDDSTAASSESLWSLQGVSTVCGSPGEAPLKPFGFFY